MSPLCYRLLAVTIARLAVRPVEASTWWRVEGIDGKLERNALNSEPESCCCPPMNRARRNFVGPVRRRRAGVGKLRDSGSLCAATPDLFSRDISNSSSVDSFADGNRYFVNENGRNFSTASKTPILQHRTGYDFCATHHGHGRQGDEEPQRGHEGLESCSTAMQGPVGSSPFPCDIAIL